jgi:predicted transcriptional regulator
MTITVQISEQNARQLDFLMAGSHCSRDDLVNAVLAQHLEEEAEFRRDLEESIKEMDAGLGIPHAQVMAEMEAIIQRYEA